MNNHFLFTRFATAEDFSWFEKATKLVLDEEIKDKFEFNVDATHYFVDFMR